MRMTPEFFEMIKNRLEPRIARQATNYRAPISVGEKLALTIRYLATGESYTSLSCQFRVGRSTISKFLPEFCRAIQDEFTSDEWKDEWKELEREFRIRGRFNEASFILSFLKVKEGGFLTFGKASLKSCFTKPPSFHLTKDFP